MYQSIDMLKGKVVFALRRGHYPPSALVKELMAQNPNTVFRVETIHVPYTTFVVTAAPFRH
jgi:hypothetical protein